jgi:hypothetical protein
LHSTVGAGFIPARTERVIIPAFLVKIVLIPAIISFHIKK